MLLIFGIAGAAAIAVVAFDRFRDAHPDAATNAARRVGQLASVVLILARAVEGIFDALAAATRPRYQPVTGSPWDHRHYGMADDDDE